MKKRWIMLIAVVMLFAFAAGAVAGPAVQNITASLATDIKITLNGKDWTPKDANGNAMAPIIYNGSTYLPVRAVGEAVGVKVDWNADTRTVILGEAPAKEEPKAEEPVKEEPKKEEPVKEEPKKDVKLAVSPTGSDFSKSAPADIPINITWGPATKVTAVTGSALGGAVKIDPKEGTDYTVTDKGDGTAVLTIKTQITARLPVPIAAVPEGTVLTLTIVFDNGEKADFAVKVAK